MKLRIRGNTLRLRLTRPEIEKLADTGTVEDRIRFGPLAILTYQIKTTADTTPPTASFDQSTITIRISNADMKTWTASELVGIYRRYAGDEANLDITLEKDFTCLDHRPSEDDSENFPNPKSLHRPEIFSGTMH